MKNIFLLLSLTLVVNTGFAQSEKNVLGFDGIGDLKLDMLRPELEKMLNTKFTFKQIGITESYMETIPVTYKGISFELELMGSDQQSVRLEGISTTSPVYKTKEGIGIGSDQQTIINAYEKHLLIIHKESITFADIDNIRSSIVFEMKNNKVVKIRVEPTAAFRDRE